MRIFLDSDKEEIIERDIRVLKVNYSSCKSYFIETVILKKKLVFDYSMINMDKTIYVFTDLKASYDCQLSKLRSIIEEAVGRDRNAMLIFTKILPIQQQYICTGYRISEKWYGGVSAKLVGTGQGNNFSGELCKDTSCLIIKQIENLSIEFEFNSYFIKNIEQIVVLLFVNNTDLITNSKQNEIKMKKYLKYAISFSVQQMDSLKQISLSLCLEMALEARAKGYKATEYQTLYEESVARA